MIMSVFIFYTGLYQDYAGLFLHLRGTYLDPVNGKMNRIIHIKPYIPVQSASAVPSAVWLFVVDQNLQPVYLSI